MAINPLLPRDEELEEAVVEIQPSRTYAIDFENNVMVGMVDGERALRQFIRKALATARDRFLVYDDQYGSELDDLIGAPITRGLIETEIPRLITEALIYDDRIESVDNFEITYEKDTVFVTFTVNETLTEEVEIVGI